MYPTFHVIIDSQTLATLLTALRDRLPFHDSAKLSSELASVSATVENEFAKCAKSSDPSVGSLRSGSAKELIDRIRRECDVVR